MHYYWLLYYRKIVKYRDSEYKEEKKISPEFIVVIILCSTLINILTFIHKILL